VARVIIVTIRNQLAFGPRILHRLAEQHGHDVTSLFIGDHFLDPRPVTAGQIAQATAWIAHEQPDVLAVSLTSYAFQDAIALSDAVRRHLPGALILWGGHHPTIAARECVSHCDLACRGEGEETFLEVLRAVDEAAGPDTMRRISNLSWQDPDGGYRENAVRPVETDLDRIPTPDFSNRGKLYMYGDSLYEVEHDYDDTTVYYTMTSRGCPYSCTFCCISYMREMYRDTPGRYLRRRSVESVISELEAARAHYPSLAYVYFFDDVFVWDLDWLKRFSEAYKLRVGLPFWCYGYVNTTREPMLQVLAGAGLEAISMGIQSGSEHVRKEIYMRPESDAAVLRAARMVKNYGLRITWDLICGPFESRSDKERAFELFFQLPKPFRFHFHPLSYYRNLGVTRRALESGIITEDKIVGGLRQLTQSVTDFETWTKTPAVIDDPHYRLLCLFGKRHIPNALIRALVHADKRLVTALVRLHDRVAPPDMRVFPKWQQSLIEDAGIGESPEHGPSSLRGAAQVPV
jgi:radical SAM superfamily enzyme YgiQ (UPF0313 family)